MSDAVNKFDMKNCHGFTTTGKHPTTCNLPIALIILKLFKFLFYVLLSMNRHKNRTKFHSSHPLRFIPDWIARNLSGSWSKTKKKWVDEFISIWKPKPIHWNESSFKQFWLLSTVVYNESTSNRLQRVQRILYLSRNYQRTLQMHSVPGESWRAKKFHSFICSCGFSAKWFVCAPLKFRWNITQNQWLKWIISRVCQSPFSWVVSLFKFCG